MTMIASFDGTQLYLNREVSDDNTCVAVIVHGLCEHQGRYDYLAGLFHQNGIGAYRFDHRGHGRSEGENAYYGDYNDMLDDVNVVVDIALAENPDRPVFLVGHSMGGFAVSLYGVKYPGKRLRGIVTSGAVTHDRKGLISSMPRNLDPHMQLPNELGSGVCSVPEVVEWYGQDPYNRKSFAVGLCYALMAGWAWFEEKQKEFAYPVLMLHGEDDALVSVQDTYDFFAAAASKDRQMKVYGGLYHEIFNEYCHDEVIGDAIRWILARA
jgi:alpha-beta hydrolase superfamily lysophospholipase